MSSAANPSVEPVARYYTTKHSWRGKYKRMMAIGLKGIQTINPTSWEVTNTWPYGEDVTDIMPSSKTPNEFTLATNKGKKNLTFSCENRVDLLTDANLHRPSFGGSATKKKGAQVYGIPYRARKAHWSEQRIETLLCVGPAGLAQLDPRNEQLLCIYLYKDIEAIIPVSDYPGGFAIQYNGFSRLHVFAVEKRDDLFKSLSEHANTYIGLVLRASKDKTITMNDFTLKRLGRFGDDESITSMAEFIVQKETPRHQDPIGRILCLTERCLLERDPGTYNIVTLRSLLDVFALIRHQEDIQRFTVEYKNGDRRSYISTERDSLLATVLDGVRACGNRDAYIRLVPTSRPTRVGSLYIPVEENVETVYLRLIAQHESVGSGMSFADAIVAFNTNVDYSGLHHAETKDQLFAVNKEQLITAAMTALLSYTFDERARASSSIGGSGSSAIVPSSGASTPSPAPSAADTQPTSSALAVAGTVQSASALVQQAIGTSRAAAAVASETFLALRRLFASKAGFEAFTQVPSFREKVGRRVVEALRSHDEGVQYAAIDMLSALMQPMHDNYDLGMEQTNKGALLTSKDFCGRLADLLGRHAIAGTGALVVCSLLDFFTFALCAPYSETTDAEQFDRTLELIAGLGRRLFKLFLHPSMAIVKGAGMVMKAIIEEGTPEISAKMQQLALAECSLLKHLHTSMFTTSLDTRLLAHRELSRNLVGLWTAENEDAKLLVKRMLPAGLLTYLDSKDPPPKEEIVKLQVKDNLKSAQSLMKAPSELQVLLRHWRTRIGIAAKPETQQKPIVLRRRRQHVKVQRNWPLLYYQLKQDHSRPDLIWNHKTREELREACEAELRAFNIDKDLGGLQVVSWNFIEFEVRYESLNDELKIGDHYVRLLLEQGTNGKVDIHDPPIFFNDLYHRFLLATTLNMKVLCLQALAIVYNQCSEEIGTFNDTPYIVGMLQSATSRHERDRLVVFLEKLLRVKTNVKLFLDVNGVRSLVDLLTLCHLHTERAVTPLQSNVLESGSDMQRDSEKEWYYSLSVASATAASDDRQGPFGFDELREKYKTNVITNTTRCWAQGMDGWRKLQDISQLKWMLVYTEPGAFNETQLAVHILNILNRICEFYPSRDEDGAIIRPLPRAKRLLSEPSCLPHIVNVLLTFDPTLVEKVALLLNSIMADNPVMPKLYLTGAFFFALMYTGSNVLPISRFLADYHTKQAFRPEDGSGTHEITRRSILGTTLPEAMVCFLENHGAEKFSEIFLGEFDTPETIWNAEMRRLMIEKIALHLAEFSPRLMSNTRALYQYAPTPAIQFPQLENELFCNVYYLRHLCDLGRFDNWPIGTPIELLKDCLDAWRLEVDKKPPTITADDALSVLGLDPTKPIDDNQVRKSYFRLAAKYHPDKNPEGREMFEKVLKAYEFLGTKAARVNGPDPARISLLLQAQSIIFHRYADIVRPYKYAGYPLLIRTIDLEITDDALFSKSNVLLPHAAELAFHTINVSALNTEELRREGGLDTLAQALSRCVSMVQPSTSPKEMPVQVCRNVIRCFSSAATFEQSRERLRAIPTVVPDVCRCLYFKGAPLLTLAAIECVSQLALDATIQNQLLDVGGALWHLLSFIFNYDFTLDESGVQASAESNQQEVANTLAKSSVRALARLGGYTHGENATPRNPRVQAALSTLITAPLARKMGKDEVPLEVLKALTSNSETAYFIWNNGTRAELMDFVERQAQSVVKTGDHDRTLGASFVFSDLRDELKVGDVYLRVYIAQPTTVLEDTTAFMKELLGFLAHRRVLIGTPAPGAPPQLDEHGNPRPALDPAMQKTILNHCRLALDAMRVCIVNNQGAEKQTLAHYDLLFSFFRLVEDPEVQRAALLLVGAIVANKDCVTAISEANVLVDLVLLFEFLPGCHESILTTLHALASKPKIVADCITRCVVIHLLHIFSSSKRGSAREEAASVIVKLVSDKLHGPKVAIIISKFIPAIFVEAMRESVETAIHMFEGVHENPELIWNDDARNKVKQFLVTTKAEIVAEQLANRDYTWRLPDDFEVVYSELQGELLVGGVYLRLFLKQPSWALRNPRQFLVSLFDKFIQYSTRGGASTGSVEQSMLDMLSQSIVYLLKAQPMLLDQVAAAGHVPKIVLLLESESSMVAKAAVDVIHGLADGQSCCDALAQAHVLKGLMKVMQRLRTLSGMGCESVKKLIEHNNCERSCLVVQAIQMDLVGFLLTLLGPGLENIEAAAAIKAQVVKALKQMTTDITHGADVEQLLAKSEIWNAFKDQKHDLFITNTTVAGYLTGPVTSVKGYLTAGPANPTGPPPTDHE
ncbi:DnaJ domain-containing protein RME-8 [Capsaspora owczarzaki ATCC 30864]|uniref:DnaJ domain-containing protein RME-8 n=1 Tax=Capsaspora owczarzaki (strain ATCC 30864) TaxID=595528 RepID=A0A0D2WKP4_CAPO3|nr:DnaJ domain-containing protein RME-8 [Capsaspora owczarzaki ATCC 30864]KJE90900.1 DnaJ domain-containing protein RME-8 [Capsaspora owczarzaki ATCC 30864]|eukprot:XP_004348883.1 DnaJ domain-containing protein RME-8 [Capsaspora owczarzaki ATCC 30864]